MSPLLQLTATEVTAARLRKMARDLVLEAEALEAAVKRRPGSTRPGTWYNPVTGKVENIKRSEL